MSHDDLDDNRHDKRHRRLRDDVDPAATNDHPGAPTQHGEPRRGVVVPLERARGRPSRRPHAHGGPDDDPGPTAA